MMKRLLLSLLIGAFITVALVGLSYFADQAGFRSLAEWLFWQNFVLQDFVPLNNIGTPEHPLYEGTPLNFIAFIASIPLGIVVYGAIAFLLLYRRQRRT